MSFGNKIGELQPTPTTISRTSETRISHNAKENSAARSMPSLDEATVSSTGALVANALQTSDVRMDKVEALRQAISSGSYAVSSSQVADSIIKSMTK